MRADNIENIVKYLKSLNIEVDYDEGKPGHLNREIEFKIEGVTYWIEWWVNQSYFKLQKGFSKPKMPFKYINLRTTSPTTLHHDQLCFYDVKEPNTGQFIYNEIPFGSFAIPFNIKN